MVWKLILAVLVGLAIGAALGGLAWRWMARRQERARQTARYRELVDSLDVLSRALLQGQVDSSEASIRMAVLLDCLPPDVAPKVDLAAIHQLAEDCGGFDRGEERRRLTPAERNRQDLARLQLEDDQNPAVLAAAGRLQGVIGEWRTRLSA
ncbi:DUF2489 domain-containing protein [Alcanivorax marinus]|uniref:DUF2489 domain-containing protein n=1 Tax=Alloalcanivorax marinus TaxID=1177169 RepID=A0A9Q3UQ79_9GAMM|nr:DUF2489 domain-containing protein [Alloalcanivorax marinus]MCC4309594.1 DUF2489 domain-containing protein [Alloalcanivorax marinus]MCU5785669.1 hypothetical protein [Alloalcanivorax marinus]